MIKVIDTKFAFPRPSVPGSFCRFRIYQQSDSLSVVLISQIPDQGGTSLTNAVEEIATAVLRQYKEVLGNGIQPPTWLQHFPIGSLKTEMEPLLHLVTFCCSSPGLLVNPAWKRVSSNYVETNIIHSSLDD